jgi:hypothetical protein
LSVISLWPSWHPGPAQMGQRPYSDTSYCAQFVIRHRTDFSDRPETGRLQGFSDQWRKVHHLDQSIVGEVRNRIEHDRQSQGNTLWGIDRLMPFRPSNSLPLLYPWSQK